MDLHRFLQAEAAIAYPGPCCRMADRWFALRKGFSALARYGRDYQSEEEAAAWLAEPGGVLRGVLRVMDAAGVPRTRTPAPGDVGLVKLGPAAAMAIFDGRLWHTRDENGIASLPADHALFAWSLA